jgi:hypothetical protein
MKIRPLGAESFRVETHRNGRIDRNAEASSRLSQLCIRA